MPNSRKRFSKNKKSVKESTKSRKNTRKHKKTKPRRKYKKSSKRFRFFGGDGEDDICSICHNSLTNGEEIFTTNCINPRAKSDEYRYFHHKFHTDCIRQWCSVSQNQNQNQICRCPLCNAVLNLNLYRVEFFKVQQNPSTGKIEGKEKIDVRRMSHETIYLLNEYFKQLIPGLEYYYLDFSGHSVQANNPNGYINLYNNPSGAQIPLGNLPITIYNPAGINAATITQTNTHH
jgi:hypothetical protein